MRRLNKPFRFFTLLLSVWSLAAAGFNAAENPTELAENLVPRRQLSVTEQRRAADLKKEITIARRQLITLDEPLVKSEQEIKIPSDWLAQINGHLAAMDTLIARVAGQKLTPEITAEIDAIARRLPTFTYAMRVKNYLRTLNERPSDHAAQATARQKMLAAAHAMLRLQTEKLNAHLTERRKLDEKRAEQVLELSLLRRKLDTLNGYGSPTDVLQMSYAEANETAARQFFQQEMDFVLSLQRRGMGDWAEKYAKKVAKRNNPFTGAPLSADLQKFVRRELSRLPEWNILQTPDLRKKIAGIPQLIADLSPPDSPQNFISLADYQSAVDYYSVFFNFADDLALMIINYDPPSERRGVPYDDIFNEDGEFTLAALTLPLPRWSERDLIAMTDAELAVAAASLAKNLYYRGLSGGMALTNAMKNTFRELIDYSTLTASSETQELLQQFAQSLQKMRDETERAWCQLASLYPLVSARREELGLIAERYIRRNLRDYSRWWTDNNRSIGHLMLALSFQSEPAGEKKDAADMSGGTAVFEPLPTEQLIPEYLDAPSAKIEWVFTRYFTGEAKSSPAERLVGWLLWAQSLSNLTRAQYELSDETRMEIVHKAYRQSAERLQIELFKRFEEAKAIYSPEIGKLPSSIISEMFAKTAIPYYLFRSRHALRQRNSEANKWAQEALDATNMSLVTDGEKVRQCGERAVAVVIEFGKRNRLQLHFQEAEKMQLQLLIENVNVFYRLAIRDEYENRPESAQENFRRCRELGVTALARLTNENIEIFLPPLIGQMLYRFAVSAFWIADYDTAWMASRILIDHLINDENQSAKDYISPAVRMLRVAAWWRAHDRGDLHTRLEYIEDLQTCIRYDDYPDDLHALCAEYRAIGLPGRAAQFIDQLPANKKNLTSARLGAELYFDLTRQVAKMIDDANNVKDGETAAPSPNELLNGRLIEYFTKTNIYIDHFSEIAYANGNDDKTDNDPAAEVFALRLLRLRAIEIMRDWNELRRAAAVITTDLTATALPADIKKSIHAEATWFDLLAQLAIVKETRSLTTALALLSACDRTCRELADSDYALLVPVQMSNAWIVIYRQAEQAGDSLIAAHSDEQSLLWLSKSRDWLYRDLRESLMILQNLAENKLWDHVINIGREVVNFWGEALFTPDNLFQPGKSATDLAVANPTIAKIWDRILPEFAQINNSPKQLLEKFNGLITGEIASDPENWRRIVTETLVNGDPPTKRFSVWKQAERLTDWRVSEAATRLLKNRPHLAEYDNHENNQIARRTALEMIFPELYQRPLTLRLREPELFYAHFAMKDYSPENRERTQILNTLADPLISLDDARVIFGPEYPQKIGGGKINEWQSYAENADDGVERLHWRRLLRALEVPLVISLYGEKNVNGEVIGRDFRRAAFTLEVIANYLQSFISPGVDSVEPTRMLTVIERIRGALDYETQLLTAKRYYAQAIFKTLDFSTAENYLRTLCAQYPNDHELTLELARVYLAEALYSDRAETPRSYTIIGENSSVERFAQALTQAVKALRYSTTSDVHWWEARLLTIEIELSHLETRIRSRMTGELPNVPLQTIDGKPAAVRLGSVNNGLERLQWVLQRQLLAEKIPNAAREKLTEYLQRLQKISKIVRGGGLSDNPNPQIF